MFYSPTAIPTSMPPKQSARVAARNSKKRNLEPRTRADRDSLIASGDKKAKTQCTLQTAVKNLNYVILAHYKACLAKVKAKLPLIFAAMVVNLPCQ